MERDRKEGGDAVWMLVVGEIFEIDLGRSLVSAVFPFFQDLTKLLEMIKLAGINLSTGGPYTLFAPTNKAWDSLPPRSRNQIGKPEHRQVLKDCLLYHFLTQKKTSGRPSTHSPTRNTHKPLSSLPAGEIQGTENCQTVYQRETDFSTWPSGNVPVMVRKWGSGKVTVNAATVVKSDIVCDDGMDPLMQASPLCKRRGFGVCASAWDFCQG